jgi:hypothetical protein
MEISMAYPMEISRTWKFPWVKPAATHGNFQGLEISMTWKIPLPDTYLPLRNILQGIYTCSAICSCLFEIYTRKKSRGGGRGGFGQRPNFFQYFLQKPSRIYSNFCFKYCGDVLCACVQNCKVCNKDFYWKVHSKNHKRGNHKVFYVNWFGIVIKIYV